jgi:hypothetical protein
MEFLPWNKDSWQGLFGHSRRGIQLKEISLFFAR